MSQRKMQKHKTKLFVVDLDGTLLTDDKRITEGNKAALKRFMEAGGLLAVATGRTWPGAKAFVREIQPNCPVITSNGALWVNPRTGRTIHVKYMEPEDARAVYGLGQERDITQMVWCKNRLYTSRLDELSQDYSRRFGKIPARPIASFDELLKQGILKILWYIPGASRKTAEENPAKGLDMVNMTCSSADFLEFFHCEASKGESLRELTKRYGIDLRDTAAIGDSENDWPMLCASGFGIVMGNAPEQMKEKAVAVTLDNEHDGVAYALSNFVEV